MFSYYSGCFTANRSRLFRWFCTGGIKSDQTTNIELSFIPKFFKETYTPFLLKLPVKVMIFCIYGMYIAVGIWGCTSLREELQLKELVPPNSYVRKYLTQYEKNFAENYGPEIMFAFNETIDYSDSDVRDKVLNIVEEIQTLEYFLSSPDMVKSWLREYSKYLGENHQNPQNMSHFIEILTTEFLSDQQYQMYGFDVNINDEKTHITNSRFFCQTYGVSSTSDEKNIMLSVREFAVEAEYEMVVYHNTFIINDQYTVIVTSTVQTIGIAVASAFIVSMVLLSNMVAIFWVTLSVISIFVGVIGYLVLWGGTLNYLTAMYLSMCVGFSVDFSAHICYHFVHCPEKNTAAKTEQCLTYLGHPILQGTLSTILAVIVLVSSQEYIFFTFFRVVFLVMIIGLLHGVVFIPVMLSTITDVRRKLNCCNKNKQAKDKENLSQGSLPEVKEVWVS